MATRTDDDGATAPTLPLDPPSGERVLPATKRKVRGGALLGKRRKHKATVSYRDASHQDAGAAGASLDPPSPDELESGILPRRRASETPHKASTTEPSPSGPLSSGITVKPARLESPSELDFEEEPPLAPPGDLGDRGRTSLDAPGTVDELPADPPSLDEPSIDGPARPVMASRPEFARPESIGGVPSTERSPSEPGGGAIDTFGDDYDDDAFDRETEGPDPHLGRTVAERYEIVDVIGEGGMGRVYLGHHNRLGKQVALKILHADLARDKAAVGRFVREARAASSIGNPHIVDVSDFGELPDGSTYFVMEFLDGATLADLLDEKDLLDPAVVIDIGCQLCDGLAAAHEQDIIHRDLKPENVVLVERNDNPRFCKILDFGIAKVSAGTVDGQTKLTLAGTVFGTPHYMSPEQAAGSTVDHRADIYSLGVMLYEMAAGDLPFDADNFMGLLTQHMYKAPPAIRARTLGEGCPAGLEAVILKCLAKRPEARYASMEELAADLKREAEGLRPEALDDDTQATARIAIPAEFLESARLTTDEMAPAPPAAAPWTRVAGIGLAVGLVVGGVGYTLTQRSPPSSAAQPSPSTAPVPAPATPPVTSASAIVPITTSATPPDEAGRQVLLHSPIPGAVAYVDDEPVLLPTNIVIPEGETKEIDVVAKGYHRRKVVVDGKRVRVTIALAPVAGRADPYEDIPPPPPAARPKPKRPSADVIVEPWE